MRIAYLDCFAGVAGDMWVGALLDLGLPLDDLRGAVDGLGLPGVSVEASRVLRSGLAATRFQVRVEGSGQSGRDHRHLADIVAILERARLPAVVRERSVATFTALAEVEARVHAQPLHAVHFHEVGAVDTIVDVVCACLGVHLLGIERIYSSAVAVGSGTVRCEHGELPVPAPGALGNLFGVPVRSGGPPGERTTPTGAALLRVLVDAFEPRLDWVPERAGCGAGARDDEGLPNLLRITLGAPAGPDAAADPTGVTEVSCNLDTASGETLAYLLDGALARGAVDAWVAPITMKKGRPGHLFSALVPGHLRDGVVAFLLEESSSLGVRLCSVTREVLERWSETLDTELGPVRFKSARLPSGQLWRRPEEDEVRRLCEQLGITRREVRQALARARD